MSKKIYIAKLSGGKDSTAMVDLLLRNNYPLDYILFCDTLAEFGAMYEYLDKLDAYFKKAYGKSITRTKPKKSINEAVFSRVSKGEHKGEIKGAFLPQMGYCDWRLYSKLHTEDDFIKSLGISKSDVITYLGITIDEKHRADLENENLVYPLITDFKMSERDCQNYLKERELENPLYRHFTRTGCAFCPAQSMRAKFNLWKYYPSEWQKIKELESEILAQEAKGEKIYNKYWFNKWSVDELETRFKAQDDGCGSLFDDEPLKDCFCKF